MVDVTITIIMVIITIVIVVVTIIITINNNNNTPQKAYDVQTLLVRPRPWLCRPKAQDGRPLKPKLLNP